MTVDAFPGPAGRATTALNPEVIAFAEADDHALIAWVMASIN